ncbi:hypothetical protein QL285_007346 [Trifolium repens]|nr:hypothetical protein QL285_007346 [Trifolium repens]
MDSKSVASITILILSLNIFFFTTLSSAQAPTVSPSPPPVCPNFRRCASLFSELEFGEVPRPKYCCQFLADLTDADAIACLSRLVEVDGYTIPLEEILRVCGRNIPNLAPPPSTPSPTPTVPPTPPLM